MEQYSEPFLNGFTTTFTDANPGAGINFSVSLDPAATWEILQFSFLFTASAAAGNRFIGWQFTSPSGTNNPTLLLPTAVIANGVHLCTFMQGFNGVTSPVSTDYLGALPLRYTMRGSYALSTRIVGLLGGDQISGPTYTTRRWLTQTV